MKLTTKKATIRHSCTSSEIVAHMRAIETKVLAAARPGSVETSRPAGPLVVEVRIPLAKGVIVGTIDARASGEVSIEVEGPSLIVALFSSKAIGQIRSVVREQLGDKLLGASLV